MANQTIAGTLRRAAAAAVVVLVGTGLAACGEEDTAQKEGLEVTTSQTPDFVPEEAAQKRVDATEDNVEDPGLHLRYTLQGTVSGQAGGSIITVEVENLNDVPVPPDALAKPALELSDGSTADLMDAEAAGVAGQDGLGRPLGAGATTNLRYPFNVSPGSLSSATFTLGNVVFEGQL